ncbi:hypothetical protein TOPH_06562 [Tolypocladium ophioglossoides CBS 100239]|uniref:Uncharacterized protein n=1 Tax=Tolypocladium ophioglossoides (strain CBS 100239) TaxID=1163406 RepID=A0A0L0N408_TOLOC|nr:hypothetical protein TOPH_06562 [Tolypocladium ophioglossoides CBS 100239]
MPYNKAGPFSIPRGLNIPLRIEPLVRSDKPNPQHPARSNAHDSKRSVARHANEVARAVRRRVQIRRVHVRGIRHDIYNGHADGLLLGRGAQRGRYPAEDHRVDGVGAARKHEARDVPSGPVERGGRDDEADECESHASGDVPRPLVVSPRGQPHEVSEEAGDQIGGAGEHEGQRVVEAQRSNDCREEVVERAGREVHVLHKAQQPEARVTNSLGESRLCPSALLKPNCVAEHPVMGELSLLRRQPSSRQRSVSQREHGDACDAKRHGALDYKQPLPARESTYAVKSVEGCRGDETRERGRKDVPRVQYRYAGGDFSAGVKGGEQIDRAWIEGRFRYAEEEAHED